MALPKVSDMFADDNNPADIAGKFEAYKDALNKSLASPRPAPGAPEFAEPREASGVESLQKALGSTDVTKALSPELVDSVRNALAQSDLGKDWTLGTGSNGNPVSTGLVAFDLEAPSKILVPRPTPLRNRIARRKGVGLAHRFKRITGWTGSGTGGATNNIFRPGITESSTNAFGSVNYLRGAKISYTGDDQAVNYKQFSVSDQVSWAAQYAGQGYEDVRQLSQTAVLWSSMLLEERMLLGARGTDSGFVGALASPSVGTLVVNTPGTGEVGNSANIATLYVGVTAVGVWGESAPTVVSTTGLSAATAKVVSVPISDVPGALGYRVYAGVSNATANGAYTGLFPAQIAQATVVQPALAAPGYIGTIPAAGTVDIQFTGGGTGGAPNSGANPATADTSAAATDYDGILSYCTGANAGYVKRINSTLSTSNPGNEFNVAFASLYDSVKADPDLILANGNDRKQLSDTLKTGNPTGGGVGNSYRITLDGPDVHGAQIGSMVTGIQNEVTGKMVDVMVHPWLPQGNMPIISWTLPLPDSQVSEVFAAYNVQDYMGIQWPVTQFAYETSSYWFGTMVCYAPAWNGCIQGIFKS